MLNTVSSLPRKTSRAGDGKPVLTHGSYRHGLLQPRCLVLARQGQPATESIPEKSLSSQAHGDLTDSLCGQGSMGCRMVAADSRGTDGDRVGTQEHVLGQQTRH